MKITFKDLEDSNCPSVTDYCRLLLSENLRDYTGEIIEVYRGEMLCLTITDITAAATLEPTGEGWRKVRHRRLSQPRGCV